MRSTAVAKQGSKVLDEGFGRWEERHKIKELVESKCSTGGGGTIVITGERGLGKAALMKQLRQQAEQQGMAIFTGKMGSGNALGSNDTKSQSLPQLPEEWEQVFANLLLQQCNNGCRSSEF